MKEYLILLNGSLAISAVGISLGPLPWPSPKRDSYSSSHVCLKMDKFGLNENRLQFTSSAAAHSYYSFFFLHNKSPLPNPQKHNFVTGLHAFGMHAQLRSDYTLCK